MRERLMHMPIPVTIRTTLFGAILMSLAPAASDAQQDVAAPASIHRSNKETDREPVLPGQRSPKTAEIEQLAAHAVRLKNESSELSSKLQKIAIDESYHQNDRRIAIFALAELGDEGSLDFLAHNISMSMSVSAAASRDWLSLRRPCSHALWVHSGVNIVPVLLKQLSNDRNDVEIRLSAGLLRKHLGVDGSSAALVKAMSTTVSDKHRDNLQRLRNAIEAGGE